MSAEEARATGPSRRSFLRAAAWALPPGMALALGVPGAMYLATPLLQTDEGSWVDLGEADVIRELPEPTELRFQIEALVGYVRGRRSGLLLLVPAPEEETGLVAFSAVCSHKGCNVSWSGEEQLFACPCHRGRFAASGEVVSGPPTEGLRRLQTRIEEGRLLVLVREGEA